MQSQKRTPIQYATLASRWLLMASVLLMGCGPEVSVVSNGTTAENPPANKTCVLGQSTVGNCILQPK